MKNNPNFCTNRNYMNKAFMSSYRRCPSCNWEISFMGKSESGIEVLGFCCSFEPKQGDENVSTK